MIKGNRAGDAYVHVSIYPHKCKHGDLSHQMHMYTPKTTCMDTCVYYVYMIILYISNTYDFISVPVVTTLIIASKLYTGPLEVCVKSPRVRVSKAPLKYFLTNMMLCIHEELSISSSANREVDLTYMSTRRLHLNVTTLIFMNVRKGFPFYSDQPNSKMNSSRVNP